MGNLETAQHRDRQWYTRRKIGGYRRPQFEFRRGDFVYLKENSGNTLDRGVSPSILQVMEVLKSGVLKLKEHKEHMSNCLPRHVPIVERTVGQLEQLQTHPDVSAGSVSSMCGVFRSTRC